MPLPVTITRLTKRFGKKIVLRGIDLAIQPGELFFLLGPSGCGKTTLLRAIAGLNIPEEGQILLGDTDVTTLPPHRRGMAMVFQSYALWPHLTLLQNVAFGLEMRRTPKAETRRRALEALDLVHLADRADSKPNELSGGQQQRVALARALVIHPRCLLLDEPLSNLDAKLRLDMRTEIRRICKEAGLTAIYVTHDQKEALAIADRLAILDAGRVVQVGTPMEVYTRPATCFAAQFIGETTFVRGTVRAVAPDGSLDADTPAGPFRAAPPAGPSSAPAPAFAPGDPVALSIRPEAVLLHDESPAGTPNTFPARIHSTQYLGETAQHAIDLDGGIRLKALEIRPAAIARDDARLPTRIRIPPAAIVPLPPESP